MKKRSISLIIGLMSIALFGVLAVQVYFMNESYRLKSELFNQSVNAALITVVSKLEKQDAFNFLYLKEKEQQDQARYNSEMQFARSRVQTNVSLKPPTEKRASANQLAKSVDYIDSTGYTSRYTHSPGTQFYFSSKQQADPVYRTVKNGALYGNKSGTLIYNKSPQPENPIEKISRLIQKEQSKSDSLFEVQDSLFKKRFPGVFSFRDVKPEGATVNLNLQVEGVEYEDDLGQLHQRITKVFPRSAAVQSEMIRQTSRKDSIANYLIVEPAGVRVVTFVKPTISQISVNSLRLLEEDFKNHNKEAARVNRFVDSKVKSNKNAVMDLVAEFNQMDVSLSKRISPYVEKTGKNKSTLDSLLRAELKNQDIDIPYQYKVSSARKDSVIFNQISNKSEIIPENTYQTRIFPKDVVRDAGLLTITFPDKNAAILSKMTAMIGSSATLLLVLLFCFGYTIHSILKQKKLSEMKTDFINNMTHEFKTPVSTIMIASEALKDPEITGDKQRVNRLAGIIYDENVRLGNHIERVLNIAKIDKEDLKLEHKPVEVNDLVAAVTDSMALQLQKKNVKLSLSLDAEKQVVKGDELHLSNVLFNLVDNAIKYSREEPEVAISTFNQGDSLIIRIADKGIGMSREHQSKIFEQFYRIPTGNLHDVKGFGLGLSYVHNIVQQLNGTIKVKSEKDKGSEFDISLPLA